MSTEIVENKTNVKVDSDYPLSHVPVDKRKSFFSVAAVLLGITFFTPTMAAGAQIGAAFRFSDLIWIMLVGNVILGIYVAINCSMGAETGLTSVLLSKYTLGNVGAKWADFLLGGTQVGWYAVVCSYVGALFAKGLGLPNLEVMFTLFWSLVFGVTALWGYKAMEKVAYVAIPSLLILVFYVPYLAIRDAGGLAGLNAVAPISEMTVATAMTVIVGTFASMGTQACNWSRFSKNSKSAFWAGLIAFLIGNLLMLFSGVVGALAYGESDFVIILMNLGIIFFALAVLTLNIWTTAHAGAYAFGVAGAEFFNKPSKTPFVIGGVIIATILACTGFYAHFIPFLVMLGIFIPPLGGVMMGDYYFTYKRKIPQIKFVTFKSLRIAPVAAYIVGTAIAYITDVNGIGIPPLQAIIVSIFCVPLFTIILKQLKYNDMHTIANDVEYVEHPVG
ncbi:MAG: cytosine permease [Lutispora sp.]|nr:cytosine permease [Lutispora sp.]